MTSPAATWSTRREAGAKPVLRALLVIALRAPAVVRDPLLWILALAFTLRRNRPESAASAQYLSKIFGRPSRFWERHAHNLTFAHVMLDRARLLTVGGKSFQIHARGEDLIRRRVEEGEGAVLLSAHYGSFEALRAFERSLPNLSVYYLMFAEHAEGSTSLLADLNHDVSARVISLSNGPAAMLAAAEALDRGNFVGILGDRSPNPDAGKHARVPFMDAEITVPLSPYIIAMSARAPIYVCFAAWAGRGRYEIEFQELYDGEPVPHGERTVRAECMARDYCMRLEELCRLRPYNWFNFFDIWGESS